MSGLSDLYDLSDEERLVLCQELGRLTRIVPLSLMPVEASISPDAAEAGMGGPFEQGAQP